MAWRTSIALSLGSNITGKDSISPTQRINQAIQALSGIVVELRSSALVQTAPVGNTEQPRFTNAVVVGVWSGSAEDLLAQTQGLEQAAGRPPEKERKRFGPRTLDIDIILFGQSCGATGRLTVPHPRMLERMFVLQPLMEVAPDWILPQCGYSVKMAANRLQNSTSSMKV